MPIFSSLNTFNAGELSPKMLSRSDVDQYRKGCRTLRNFLVTPYGAVERRPGTRFIARTKTDDPVRLIAFAFSASVAYLCEFGDRYIRFFRNGQPVMSGNSPLEVVTPYRTADLPALRFVQSADVMTITHGSHPVHELRRTADNAFSLVEKTFQYPPVLDPNLNDAHTITPSARSGSISLTASANTFTSGNVGGYYQLIHIRKSGEIARDFTANGTSSTLEVRGFWSFTTHGTWTGNLTIQRSYDNGTTWNDFRTFTSANDSNTNTSGEEEDEDVLYRLKMTDYSASTTGTLKLCRCLFVNPDFVTTGIVRITSVTDAQHASGTVVKKLGAASATHDWNEGAWSSRRGFPRTVAYYQERMFFGGTASRPNTLWGSRTGVWDDFLLGDKDDDGIDFTLASDTVNTIVFLCQHDCLMIGTTDSEWTLSPSERTASVTPTNFVLRRHSVYGGADTAARMIGDSLVFVQRGQRKLREFIYQYEKDGYGSADLTILADHITDSGIAETALQQLPDTILWCVLADGTLAALTYEKDQQVIGWHKHTTAGRFTSCCVIPAGDRDQICFAVLRNGRRMIEIMADRELSDIRHAFFVDSGITVSGENLSAVSGLAHLAGQTVQILADGAVQRDKTVPDSGIVTLDAPAAAVTAGLPYESLLSPMPVEADTPGGTSVLRKKAIGEVALRIYGSVGGEISAGKDSFQRIIARDAIEDNLDSPLTPKTEVVKLNVISGYSPEAAVSIRQREPLPLNVASITVNCEIKES